MFALFIAAAAGLIAGGRPPISEMLGRLAPVTIAYLGDAVWELEARERALWPPNKLDTLSTQVQDICCAEGQYAVLERIVSPTGDFILDPIHYVRFAWLAYYAAGA
jgi:23S rRNA maturation mini-RNase III